MVTERSTLVVTNPHQSVGWRFGRHIPRVVPTLSFSTSASPDLLTLSKASKFAKTQYPKFWLKCSQCQSFVSASPQSVFRYIAKLLKVELDALDTRYANATKAAKEQATEQ